MPNYSSLSTQITAIKSEISASLAASLYSAQDLVYVAKALESLSHVVAPDNVDEITVLNNIYLGVDAESWSTSANLTNPTLVIKKDDNAYVQAAIQNGSNGANASTDFIAYANNGNDNSGWIDMGITSTGFSDPAFTITGANDGYVFMSAPTGTSGNGNLVLATDNTGTQNRIVFAAGGLASNNTQMTIIPNQKVHVEIPTASTSPTTGAFTVVGGVGIQGDVNIAGNITFGGTNTSTSTNNLSVESSIIYVGKNNTGDALDLGVVGEYKVGANTKYAGLVRDASDGILKIFTGASTKPTTTVNFSEAGLAYADLQVNALTASSISATSATIGNVSNTELQYLDGVTSAIQTQIDSKIASTTATATFAPKSGPTFTGTVVLPNTTSIGNVDATEISYLDGVTSAIQTQINTKQDATAATNTFAPKTSPTFSGTVVLPNTTSIGNVDSTELSYLDGVTSAIQTQINAKLDSSTASSTYAPLTAASLIRPVLTSAFETNSVSATAATGTVNVDISTASVFYYTSNAAANWTFNFRGNSGTTLNSILSNGQSATVAFLVTNGSTAYYPTAFTIDGVSVTPKWQGGVAPTFGNASSIDSYTFTIVKTASATYTVFASQVKFA